MKLFHIALFLFNIFKIAISTDNINPPNNLKMNWITAFDKKLGKPITTGKKEDDTLVPMYEMRFDYLRVSNKVPFSYFTVPNPNPEPDQGEDQEQAAGAKFNDIPHIYLSQDIKIMMDEAKKIATEANHGTEDNMFAPTYETQFKAHDPKFTVSFVDLSESDVAELMKTLYPSPVPSRISGETKIGLDYEKFNLKLVIENLARVTDSSDPQGCKQSIFQKFEADSTSRKWQIKQPNLIAALEQHCTSREGQDLDIVKQIVDQVRGLTVDDGNIALETLLRTTFLVRKSSTIIHTRDREDRAAGPMTTETVQRS